MFGRDELVARRGALPPFSGGRRASRDNFGAQPSNASQPHELADRHRKIRRKATACAQHPGHTVGCYSRAGGVPSAA